MDVLRETISAHYPDLLEKFNSLESLNWDRVYKEEKTSKPKKKKTASKNVKLSQREKMFLSLQKALVLIGTRISTTTDITSIDNVLNIKVDSKNYDELITR